MPSSRAVTEEIRRVLRDVDLCANILHCRPVVVVVLARFRRRAWPGDTRCHHRPHNDVRIQWRRRNTRHGIEIVHIWAYRSGHAMGAKGHINEIPNKLNHFGTCVLSAPFERIFIVNKTEIITTYERTINCWNPSQNRTLRAQIMVFY